jgi:hypothetical protein
MQHIKKRLRLTKKRLRLTALATVALGISGLARGQVTNVFVQKFSSSTLAPGLTAVNNPTIANGVATLNGSNAANTASGFSYSVPDFPDNYIMEAVVASTFSGAASLDAIFDAVGNENLRFKSPTSLEITASDNTDNGYASTTLPGTAASILTPGTALAFVIYHSPTPNSDYVAAYVNGILVGETDGMVAIANAPTANLLAWGYDCYTPNGGTGWRGFNGAFTSIALSTFDSTVNPLAIPPADFALATTSKAFTWSNAGSGDWNVSANWTGSVAGVPNGVDGTAVLGPAATGTTFVYSSKPITLGTLIFNNANTYDIAGVSALTFSSSNASSLIQVNQGADKLSIPLNLTNGTTVSVASGASLLVADTVSLFSGVTLTVAGPGNTTFQSPISTTGTATLKFAGGTTNFDAVNVTPNLTLNIDPATVNFGANQTSGPIILDLGGNTLRVGRTSGGANVPAVVSSPSLAVTNGTGNVIETTVSTAAVNVAGPLTVDAASDLTKQGAGSLTATSASISGTFVNVAGSSTLGPVTGGGAIIATGGHVSAATVQLDSLIVEGGATAAILPGFGTSVLNTLSLIPGASLSTLDLANNDLILHGAAEADIVADIQSGALFSSTAGGPGRDAFAGIGVITNSDGQGGALYSTFDGVPVSSTDVLVKYTYLGDTDLNGYVDANDLANLLANLNTPTTGWINGDLNYDGQVDSTDLQLLLNSLAGQTAPFGNPGGSGGSVPEPSGAILSLTAATLVALRRR